VQFVAARSPRARGVRPTDGKVDGDDQLALADHYDQQHPVNAREHPVFLAAPPGAHQAQLLAILFEHRVIAHPGPLPAAARRRTLAGGIAPQRHQHLQAQASEPLEPGTFGQHPEHARGQVLVPALYTAQLEVGAATKQRGTHHPHDFAQQFLLASQAPCDLGYEVFRQPQVIEGLVEGLGGVLRLAAVALQALPRFEAAALSGFSLFFGVSLRGRHSALLCSVRCFCG
jgi:hypothetical protein